MVHRALHLDPELPRIAEKDVVNPYPPNHSTVHPAGRVSGSADGKRIQPYVCHVMSYDCRVWFWPLSQAGRMVRAGRQSVFRSGVSYVELRTASYYRSMTVSATMQGAGR